MNTIAINAINEGINTRFLT